MTFKPLPFIQCREDELVVSEMFYSIQGEGIYVGHPSVFLRLASCNLLCVWCDTIDVWSKGKVYSFDELFKEFDRREYITRLNEGAHLVITGGEPMLRQINLTFFLTYLKEYVDNLFVEVETNGTIMPIPMFDKLVSIYNISPKLSNSKMPFEVRVRPEVMEYFSKNRKAYFKFVVENDNDVLEAMRTYILPFNIPKSKILLMPQCKSREEYQKLSPQIIEICKRLGYRFSPRLQLEVYDKATGV
jgi:6-pyruvoyltetrahydropterin 2'-reductase